MPKLFILHCPKSCGHRRPILEKHLSERGFTDVEWITDYDVNHLYVKWMHHALGETCSLAHISGLVKGLEMFRRVVHDTSDTKWFWKGDDDIVFIQDWKVPLPNDLWYVNLSVGVNFQVVPNAKPQYIGNNGGAEVFCFTREFAQLFLDNVDIRQTGDVVIHGLLNHIRHPLICIPIAQQTSLLEPKSSTLEFQSHLQEWKEYIAEFKPTGIRYEDLRNASGFFTRDNS
jgi:hypothetical protein